MGPTGHRSVTCARLIIPGALITGEVHADPAARFPRPSDRPGDVLRLRADHLRFLRGDVSLSRFSLERIWTGGRLPSLRARLAVHPRYDRAGDLRSRACGQSLWTGEAWRRRCGA